MKKQYTQIKKGSILRFHTMLGDMAGCGMIRVMFPYMHLAQYNKEIKVVPTYDMNFNFDPKYYSGLPFLQFQRSATPAQLKVLQALKSHVCTKTGTKLVYEIDDDITDIPEWNHAYDFYSKCKDSIIGFFENVDFVICSTQKLAGKINKYNKTKVIKNRLAFHWQGINRKLNLDRSNRFKILWAGSQNHFSIKGTEGDFDDGLLNYIKETQDRFEWIFIGGVPNQLKEEKITIYPWVTYLNYPSFLSSLNVDMGIAPLQQVPFNESKSNIKALEFAALGIPGVYTNIEPYKNMTLLANDSDDFINHIENLSKQDELWYDTRAKDYETLKDELFWDIDYCKFYLNMYLREIGKKI